MQIVIYALAPSCGNNYRKFSVLTTLPTILEHNSQSVHHESSRGSHQAGSIIRESTIYVSSCTRTSHDSSFYSEYQDQV